MGGPSCLNSHAHIYSSASIEDQGDFMNVTRLYCSSCAKQYEPGRLYNLCECGKPLIVAYDLEQARRTLTRDALAGRVASLWRYREVLPVEDDANILSLGEG